MTDEAATLAEVRRLLESGKGEDAISRALNITRHRARAYVLQVRSEQAHLPAVVAPAGLPSLSFYDTARQALAQAKTLSEVKDIADKAAAMEEYGRRAQDDSLKWDAETIQIHAAKEWGRLKIAAGNNKGTRGQLKGKDSGGHVSQPPEDATPTLKDLGVDKQFSANATKLAKLSDRAIEARLAARREEIAHHGLRGTMNILRPGPSRSMNRVEGAESNDPFFTPPWATRALCEVVLPHLVNYNTAFGAIPKSFWEPACGEGHMSEVLGEYFPKGFGSDIHDYGENNIRDFLTVDARPDEFDWIITNPPFSKDLAERFCLRALDLAREGVAMFVALQFLETVGRYNRLFKDRPPTLISFFAERVNCVKGRWDPDGSTDAAYVWLVWVKDRPPLPPFWIPPGQRERLSKPDDRARFAAWSIKEAIDPNTGEISEAAE